MHFNFVRWLHRGIHHGCLFVSFSMSSGWINSISYGGFTPFFKMCYGKRISFEKLNNYHGKWQSCLTSFSERVLSYIRDASKRRTKKKKTRMNLTNDLGASSANDSKAQWKIEKLVSDLFGVLCIIMFRPSGPDSHGPWRSKIDIQCNWPLTESRLRNSFDCFFFWLFNFSLSRSMYSGYANQNQISKEIYPRHGKKEQQVKRCFGFLTLFAFWKKVDGTKYAIRRKDESNFRNIFTTL